MNGNELQAWRKERGLSQDVLARHLGIFRVSVSRWEIGTRTIPSFLPLALEGLDNHLKEKTEMERKEHLEANLTKITSLADALWAASLGEGQAMKPESVKELADMIQTLAGDSLAVLKG